VTTRLPRKTDDDGAGGIRPHHVVDMSLRHSTTGFASVPWRTK
jgi:hypothetical protein